MRRCLRGSVFFGMTAYILNVRRVATELSSLMAALGRIDTVYIFGIATITFVLIGLRLYK